MHFKMVFTIKKGHIVILKLGVPALGHQIPLLVTYSSIAQTMALFLHIG